ncbi:MAG: DNA starvation/stationary phase protection protein [Bacteroidales bacterium]|jgi:starvation-inducible DNA-binding protein|nr:DNA starvation/stationary phase protection protein [Bacteroidales bacterium]
MKNFIGLDKVKAEQLAEKLNVLLANYQMYYQNLRGLHWNIKGKKFFELHLKFEELYNDAIVKIDEVAERVLTLGETPTHTYSDYIKNSIITEAKNVSDGDKGVEITLNNIKSILEIERSILPIAEDAQDEGTLTLLTDYITQQEKVAWMLASYLQ